jgi:hypothetical protein
MSTEVAGYITAWRPWSVPPEAAAFARQVVARAAPAGRERAKNLLWAAGKLAGYGTGLGLEPVPQVRGQPGSQGLREGGSIPGGRSDHRSGIRCL